VTTLSIPSIVPDDFDGGRAAPNALIEQGHAWMGFINNVTASRPSLLPRMLEANILVWVSQRLPGRGSRGRLCGCSPIAVTTRQQSQISPPRLGSRR
jgi:hypothetical protein